jgi:hypothetical protein
MSEESNIYVVKSCLFGLNYIIFILALLIVANTKKNIWLALHYENYYYFIVLILLASCMLIISTCITLTNILSVKSSYRKIYNAIFTVMSQLLLVLFYVFIGMIWYHHPKYTIIFFKEFWTEGLFYVVANKTNYYYIGDIMIRIYSTILFLLLLCRFLPCAIVYTICNAICNAKVQDVVQNSPNETNISLL